MTVEIALLRGGITLVSNEDWSLVSPHRWRVVLLGRKQGHKPKPYVVARIAGDRSILLHRLVLGATAGQIVDHINGDTLDNRRTNLRICTHRQNMQNQAVSKGRLPFKGVVFDNRRTRPYRARIRVDGRLICLGYFATPEEAAAAYDSAATRFFSDFASTNLQLGLLPCCINSAEKPPCPPPVRVTT